MDFVIDLYVWGVYADLLFLSYGLMMYSFDSRERSTYRSNLNKVDLSWDPIYLQLYSGTEFKHTAFRFWRIQVASLFGCLLSWYQVLYRVHRILKIRECSSLLASEQKAASFVLRNNLNLSKDEVIEKLTIVDPSLILTESVEQRYVGYAQSPIDCFRCGETIDAGEMVIYYGEPPARAPWTRKNVIFHYSCALTLRLYSNDSTSLTLWRNLKQRFEANEKIQQILLKDSATDFRVPGESDKPLDPSNSSPTVEYREVVVLMRALDTIIDPEKNCPEVTKFIAELESANLPLVDFMTPVLEMKSKNPVGVAAMLVELCIEGSTDSAIAITRGALDFTLKKHGWTALLPLPSFMAALEKVDEPAVFEALICVLERALGTNDSTMLTALRARLDLVTQKT